MSYIKINLGGKERGLKFNQLALEEFIRKMPTGENNQFDWLNSNALSGYACVYAGLCGSAIVKQETVDFTFEDVCNWVDEADTEDIAKAFEMFSETQNYKKLMDKFSNQIRSLTTEKKSPPIEKKLNSTFSGSTALPLEH